MNIPYRYGVHSTMTDHLHSALEAYQAEDAAMQQSLPQGKGVLPPPEKPVRFWRKLEAKAQILDKYEECVRGPQLRNYEFIKAAAKKELESTNLSLANRVVLIEIYNTANDRIKTISEVFYRIHPEASERFDSEDIQKLHKEEKLLLETNIALVEKEMKLNLKELAQTRVKILPLLDESSATPEELQERARLIKKREILEKTEECLKDKLAVLSDKLKEVEEGIKKDKLNALAKLLPNAVVGFVSDQISDSVLEDPAKEILEQLHISKENIEKTKGVAGKALGVLKNAFAAPRGMGWIVFKMGVKNLMPEVLAKVVWGTIGIALLVEYVIPTIMTVGITLKAALLGAGGMLIAANPVVGAVIVGAAAGLAIYGLGLLIVKNKVHIAKVLTPIASPLRFIAKVLHKYLQKVKSKVAPDRTPIKLRSLPKPSDPKANEKINAHLSFITDNATGNVMWHNKVQNLTKEILSLKKQLTANRGAGKEIQQELARKEDELNAAKKMIAERTKDYKIREIIDEMQATREEYFQLDAAKNGKTDTVLQEINNRQAEIRKLGDLKKLELHKLVGNNDKVKKIIEEAFPYKNASYVPYVGSLNTLPEADLPPPVIEDSELDELA